MKKIIYEIIFFTILIMIAFSVLPKQTQAISEIINNKNNRTEEEYTFYLERKAEWEEKYINKEIILDIIMKVIIGIIIFNVILFSVLLNKGRNLKSIYKIIQILLLFLIELLYIIKFSIPLPPLPPGAVYSAKKSIDIYIILYTIIESCLLKLLENRNKKYLFISTIISALILVLYEIIKSETLLIGEENLLKLLYYIIVTNILFLPLYLGKKEIKEEENVRI